MNKKELETDLTNASVHPVTTMAKFREYADDLLYNAEVENLSNLLKNKL
jgi:hypothetical protein